MITLFNETGRHFEKPHRKFSSNRPVVAAVLGILCSRRGDKQQCKSFLCDVFLLPAVWFRCIFAPCCLVYRELYNLIYLQLLVEL